MCPCQYCCILIFQSNREGLFIGGKFNGCRDHFGFLMRCLTLSYQDLDTMGLIRNDLFWMPEEILNYGTNSNLFPAAYIIPGDDKTETGGVTNELRLTLFLLDKCYRQENNALESYSYLSRAVRSFASHENGELTDLGPGYINLLLASSENFPGDLVSITVSLAAYYS